MLVELELALQLGDLQFKSHDAAQHFLGIAFVQPPPLGGIAGLVICNQVFEQGILVLWQVNQCGLHLTVHRQVIPARHPGQIRVDFGRQVGMRPKKCDQRFGPSLQVTPVRVTARHMSEQPPGLILVLQIQRQMADKRKTTVVHTDQAGQRVGADQSSGMLWLF